MKKSYDKKLQRLLMFLFCFFMQDYVFASLAIEPVKFHRVDSISGDANGDGLQDYILVSTNDDRFIKLEIYLKNINSQYDYYSKSWYMIPSYVSLTAKKGFIFLEVCYEVRGGDDDYTTTIYKYFPKLNNWYHYGWFPTFDDEAVQMLGGGDINSTFPIDWDAPSHPYSIADKVKDLSGEFTKDYNLYLSEYRSKKYDKLLLHDKYKTLDYLNYVKIDRSTVQKYNDIAFFLLEAGCNYEAILILENVVVKYPKRKVAYLNLGDAYWGYKKKEKAKKAYQQYITLMTKSGKTSLIPKRVYERVK